MFKTKTKIIGPALLWEEGSAFSKTVCVTYHKKLTSLRPPTHKSPPQPLFVFAFASSPSHRKVPPCFSAMYVSISGVENKMWRTRKVTAQPKPNPFRLDYYHSCHYLLRWYSPFLHLNQWLHYLLIIVTYQPLTRVIQYNKPPSLSPPSCTHAVKTLEPKAIAVP